MTVIVRPALISLILGLALTMPAYVHGQARSNSSSEAALVMQAARAVYRESEQAVARGTWSQRDTNVVCEEERPPFEVRIHRDLAGAIRRLEWSGGSDDHAETHRYYYDAHGELRFAFFTLGAVNGTQYEERVYYGRAGKVIRRISRLAHGPGYALRHEEGMRDPTRWRSALCQ
jgi:YD repeat-containing protein